MIDDPEDGTGDRQIEEGGDGPEDGTGDRQRTGDRQTEEGRDGPAAAPVDPGDPSAENAAFVILGALLTIFVLARVAGLV